MPIALTDEQHDGLTVDSIREQVVGVDARVPVLDGSLRTYVNFDNAASTPALRPVLETVNRFLEWYSSVHRGSGFKSQVSTEAYESAHDAVVDFVGADPETHVAVFGKNATEALNKLARRLPLDDGDVIVTSLMEHHSNDLPWRAVAQVEHVGVREDGGLDEDHLDALLARYAGRVRLVAVTGASNVTGFINPVHRIARKAHEAGAEVLVDAAQLAPHRSITMRGTDGVDHIDYLALSAHKMYAPFGTGALVGPIETFRQGDPDMVGGGVVEIVTSDSVSWAGPPDKEEAGSPNVVGAVALASAIGCLEAVGMDALAQHEAALTAHLLERLAAIDGVHVFGIADPSRAAERVGVVPFAVPGISHYLVAAILSVEGAIGVRNGCFCAHPYILNLLDVEGTQATRYQKEIRQGVKAHLPGLVRVSFGCYNQVEEIDWFAEVLERIVRGEHRGSYVQDPASGAYRAEGFEPEVDAFFSL